MNHRFNPFAVGRGGEEPDVHVRRDITRADTWLTCDASGMHETIANGASHRECTEPTPRDKSGSAPTFRMMSKNILTALIVYEVHVWVQRIDSLVFVGGCRRVVTDEFDGATIGCVATEAHRWANVGGVDDAVGDNKECTCCPTGDVDPLIVRGIALKVSRCHSSVVGAPIGESLNNIGVGERKKCIRKGMPCLERGAQRVCLVTGAYLFDDRIARDTCGDVAT